MATTIGNQLTLDGSFSDWPPGSLIATDANAVSGYQVYGALLNDDTLGETYAIGIAATSSSDPAIVPGTVIYLNTDQDNTTGYSPFGVIGAEYEVQFAYDSNNVLQAYLYSVTPGGVTAPLNGGAPLDSGFSSDGASVELAIPRSLLTPPNAPPPTSINFDVLINNVTGLPAAFAATTPEYIIQDPAAAPAATTIGGAITLDGSFTEWPSADMIMTAGNTVAGYKVYGALLNDAKMGETYTVGIDATDASDPAIGPGTVIYLNTDQDAATGFSPSFAPGPRSAPTMRCSSPTARTPTRAPSCIRSRRRRGHPAERRAAHPVGASKHGRERRSRDPEVPADAGRGNRADLDQFRHPGTTASRAAGQFHQRPGIHHRRPGDPDPGRTTASKRSASSTRRRPPRCISAAARPPNPPIPTCS